MVLLGCGSGDGSSSKVATSNRAEIIDSVPFLEGATSGSGTILRDRILVVDGSRVLAGPIPQQFFLRPGEPDLDKGWTALAVVTGDVREVLNAYAAQSSKLGRSHTCGSPFGTSPRRLRIPIQASPLALRSWTWDEVPPSPGRPLCPLSVIALSRAPRPCPASSSSREPDWSARPVFQRCPPASRHP